MAIPAGPTEATTTVADTVTALVFFVFVCVITNFFLRKYFRSAGKTRTRLERVIFRAIAFSAILVVMISSRRAAQTTPQHHESLAQPGDVVVARSTSLCGSSPEAFDEMVKWAVQKDTQEMYRTLLRTGSSVWTEGSEAKVLDHGGFHVRTDKDSHSQDAAGVLGALGGSPVSQLTPGRGTGHQFGSCRLSRTMEQSNASWKTIDGE